MKDAAALIDGRPLPKSVAASSIIPRPAVMSGRKKLRRSMASCAPARPEKRPLIPTASVFMQSTLIPADQGHPSPHYVAGNVRFTDVGDVIGADAFPVPKNGDAIGHRLDLAQLVRDENDSAPALSPPIDDPFVPDVDFPCVRPVDSGENVHQGRLARPFSSRRHGLHPRRPAVRLS